VGYAAGDVLFIKTSVERERCRVTGGGFVGRFAEAPPDVTHLFSRFFINIPFSIT
jgi:hypothetical protein